MPLSFFAIRVKSHINWTLKFKIDPWPIGSWVGSEESDGWGPRWHVKPSTYIGDADLYSSKDAGEKALHNLSQAYAHVEFELVEFKEVQ
jgi:hypothetical protein